MMPSRFARFLVPLAVCGCLCATALSFQAQAPAVPAVHSNVAADPDGQLTVRVGDGPVYTLRERPPSWTLAQLRGSPRGTANGILLDFAKPGFTGTLAFGLIPYADTKYPQPVYRTTTPIKDGQAEIDIKARLSGVYDMVGWAKSGRGVIGYRVISQEGAMLHDGRVAFKGTGPFEVDVTMLEGPFVAKVTDREAVVWFEMDRPAACEVEVEGTTGNPKGSPYRCVPGSAHQEVAIGNLAPDTEYRYTVRYGGSLAGHKAGATPDKAGASPDKAGASPDRAGASPDNVGATPANVSTTPAEGTPREETYGFRTAPRPGARSALTFGYASDCRGGTGGGERNFLGPNAHMMRRIMALAADRRLSFLQFTGDLVSGTVPTPQMLLTEYANWKRAVEPQAHWLPIYTGIGNHESTMREFAEPGGKLVRLPRFPFATESTEATFARALVNPSNGPASEDGAAYDPNPSATDFPPYSENVYSYVHDNVAMVVLNADYWWSPTIRETPQAGGNLHGYVMDRQVEWLTQQLDAFERNRAIDHVFITIHTPVFPNGGHVGDDMWYRGNNAPRPTVAGKPVAKGIVERRDDLLRLVQAHPKVLAFLTGDEHNYNRTRLGPGVEIYPAGWTGSKVALRRVFYQVNNGAAGAPYYAQEQTPWSPHVKGFSTQNALCLFHVQGPRVRMEVINPETLEVIDRAVLR